MQFSTHYPLKLNHKQLEDFTLHIIIMSWSE